MNNCELIASVAVSYIKERLDNEKEGAIRFCMVGLKPLLVSAVAKSVLNDENLKNLVTIKIPPAFCEDVTLPDFIQSDESITYWRNWRLPKDRRAVLCAAGQSEFQENYNSIEKITKIESDSLRSEYDKWINAVGLDQNAIDQGDRATLKVALKSANITHAAETILVYADFVLSIAKSIHKGAPLFRAVDYSLPSLRLPRNSGAFERIPRTKRSNSSEWNKIFQRLHNQVRPLLIRTNERGEPITDQLKSNFAEMDKQDISDEDKEIIKGFLEAYLNPDNWVECQEKLVRMNWPTISEIFDGAVRTRPVPLGKETRQFFEDEFSDALQDDEKDLLDSAFPKKPPDDLREFYESHKERLSQNKRLSVKWEKYVYKNPQTYTDILTSLIETAHNLRKQMGNNEGGELKLKVCIPKAEKKSFWSTKNAKVARYFAFRYRGLAKMFPSNVELDFGKLSYFYFPDASDNELKKIEYKSKDACTIKLEATMEDLKSGSKIKQIFFWEMPVNSIATALPDDMIDIANGGKGDSLLATANVTQQSISAKGSIQKIDLKDINTLRDAYNSNDGRLVSPNDPASNLYNGISMSLNDLREYLKSAQIDAIDQALKKFHSEYTAAIRDWISADGRGIGSAWFEKQAYAFGDLAGHLLQHANNGQARKKLWKDILRIGIANVASDNPVAIVAPWHPLKLAEINIKARECANLLQQLLQADNSVVERADLLIEQTKLDFSKNYYPEVCVGYHRSQPQLLASSKTSFDYSLHELPISDASGNAGFDANPVDAAKAFGEISERYLKLLPHERSNFSLVLYNSESKALPSSLVSELSEKVEKESGLRCDLLLAHSAPKQMRLIYEQQNALVGDDSSSVMASETARNFLSRLRVGFLDTELIDSQDGSVKLTDIVALQDVISRNAKVVWKKAPGGCSGRSFLESYPAKWSKRRPVARAETSVSSYLASPYQPKAGQYYLNALYGMLLGDNASPGDFIPAREIDFEQGDIANIFEKAHKAGEWVINFDELVERRLLKNSGVQVIRHIRQRGADRNIVISTTSSSRILRALLRDRVRNIDPNIFVDCDQEERILKKLIDRANQLSGQIVIRAARHGHYANELLGVVLSMHEIEKRLENQHGSIGWYFLDDFSSWFGQEEGKIADIMALSPIIGAGGERRLLVYITEAKYVNSQGYKNHARTSAKQLVETVIRIDRALDQAIERIDRNVWLHRLGDFMLEGMEPFDEDGWDLYKWSDAIRKDEIDIEIHGYSHVFVHSDDGPVDAHDYEDLAGVRRCQQKIFDKADTALALKEWIKSSYLKTEVLANKSNEVICEKEVIKSDGDIAALGKTLPEEECEGREDEKHPVDEERHFLAQSGTGEPVVMEDPPQRNKWPSEQLVHWMNNKKSFEGDDPEAGQWLDEKIRVLRRALRGYDMTAEVMGTPRLTPNTALVRLRGSNNLTVQKVERRREELLTSHAIEVTNVIAAPMEVIIMIRRPKRTILRLPDIWRKRDLPDTAPFSNTSLLLGAREEDGQILYLNVESNFAGFQQHGPHTLIAGETGSGKGILVQLLLLDICATNSPENARIKMIDPKAGTDFPWLRKMPHLDGNLITDQGEAVTALEELVEEMERRNSLLAESGVTKLSQYNQKVSKEQVLPRVWLFHDELADWMMIKEYRDAIELNASRLGVKARAAGINLILVTQRPDKDALPMQLRANLTNRLVLKVADKRNSLLALDETGAERLLGKGHLAAKLSGEGKVMLAQVPFIEEGEIFELAGLIQRAWESQNLH